MIIGDAGILIRGASGSGKSGLALALIRVASQTGQFASLVGDDRIAVEAANGRLIARAHPAIAGQVERHGFGIARLPAETTAVVRLVVDFLAPQAKSTSLPDPQDQATMLEGIALPRIALPTHRGLQQAADAIFAWLHHEM